MEINSQDFERRFLENLKAELDNEIKEEGVS